MPAVCGSEARLAALGLTLHSPQQPTANYVLVRRDGGRLYLAGQDPIDADGCLAMGCVGADVTVEQAYVHARNVGLGLLAALKSAAGSLAAIEVISLFGMVRCPLDFADHDAVIDGCSDLFIDVLGERGRHARTVAGMTGLADHMIVEIEVVCRIVAAT